MPESSTTGALRDRATAAVPRPPRPLRALRTRRRPATPAEAGGAGSDDEPDYMSDDFLAKCIKDVRPGFKRVSIF